MEKIEDYLDRPYKLVVVPDTVEGGYVATYPALPGCITCAECPEDVIRTAEDCKREWMTAALQDGIEIPESDVEVLLEE